MSKPWYLEQFREAETARMVGDLNKADEILGKIMEEDPLAYPAANNRGSIAMDRGDYEAAISHYKVAAYSAALQDEPQPSANLANCYFHMAVLQRSQGLMKEARRNAKQCLEYSDGETEEHWLLYFALNNSLGKDMKSYPYVQLLCKLHPDWVATKLRLGAISELLNLKKKAVITALELYKAYGEKDAKHCDVRMFACIQTLSNFHLAMAKEILDCSKKFGDPWVETYEAVYEGRTVMGDEMLRKPGDKADLVGMNCCSHVDDNKIAMAIMSVGNKSVPDHPMRPISSCSSSMVKLGYVSSDFRNHSVARFMMGFMENHDRSRFHVTWYCNTDSERLDPIGMRMRAMANAKGDRWRFIRSLDAGVLATTIGKEDEIDVLIDLNGLTDGNRMDVFCQKPAPVQVSMIGFANTSGNPGIQWRIVDKVTDEFTDQSLYTERLWKLDKCFLCYRPIPPYPEVAKEPTSVTDGIVRFYVGNRLTKITNPALNLWGRLLERVPNSRLVIRNNAFVDEVFKKQFRDKLKKLCGVEAEDRYELIQYQHSPVLYLADVSKYDISLDTFPYSGTTTTCEVLWMGVPVITLKGTLHRQNVSSSLLRAADFGFLVAESEAEFLNIAQDWAMDPGRRMKFREHARECMLKSDLCNAERHAKVLERTYLDMIESAKYK
jgi:predicted O-linked N-acetylglucosamine transferase (SPINDLY family)